MEMPADRLLFRQSLVIAAIWFVGGVLMMLLGGVLTPTPLAILAVPLLIMAVTGFVIGCLFPFYASHQSNFQWFVVFALLSLVIGCLGEIIMAATVGRLNEWGLVLICCLAVGLGLGLMVLGQKLWADT